MNKLTKKQILDMKRLGIKLSRIEELVSDATSMWKDLLFYTESADENYECRWDCCTGRLAAA